MLFYLYPIIKVYLLAFYMEDQGKEKLETPQTEAKMGGSHTWQYLAAVGVVLLLGVVFLMVVGGSSTREQDTLPGNYIIDGTSEDSNTTPSIETPPLPAPYPTSEIVYPSDTKTAWISVDWLSKWVDTGNNFCELDQYHYEGCGYSEENSYEAGTVSSGQYKGKKIYVDTYSEMGGPYFRFFIIDSNKIVYLDSAGIGIRGIDDLPEQITIPGSNHTLNKSQYGTEIFDELENLVPVFNHPTLGQFYLTELGCVVVKLPNLLTIAYDVEIPFLNESTGILEAKFVDNKNNKDPYDYTRPVCGSLCSLLHVADDATLKAQERLEVIAATASGEKLYGFIDKNAPELLEIYNDKNTLAYYGENWSQQGEKNKYSHQQFLDHRPLLYWQDPFGRWIQFRNRLFAVAAEMCKPVIYFYPKTDTQLSVDVRPDGGFTFTEPQHHKGWNIIAHPDGTITDLTDGKHYPYLFWEGMSLRYPKSTEGWIITPAIAENFFEEKLSMLGLNTKERADFKEYWVKRLAEDGKAYYKISFLTKEQFEFLAPLTMSEKPDTLIRVMMTAEGLDAPISITAPKLHAPLRKGFTVLEWGGTLLP